MKNNINTLTLQIILKNRNIFYLKRHSSQTWSLVQVWESLLHAAAVGFNTTHTDF